MALWEARRRYRLNDFQVHRATCDQSGQTSRAGVRGRIKCYLLVYSGSLVPILGLSEGSFLVDIDVYAVVDQFSAGDRFWLGGRAHVGDCGVAWSVLDHENKLRGRAVGQAVTVATSAGGTRHIGLPHPHLAYSPTHHALRHWACTSMLVINDIEKVH